MDDEEDDVFEPDPNNWRTAVRKIKSEDRGTQTPGPALVPNNGMLLCGLAEEPRPLFYARFELAGDLEARRHDREAERGGMERLPRQQPAARSTEACIAQKLQLIGDQFHRERLQLYHQNQRNQGPLWWRFTTALVSLLFDRGFIAGGGVQDKGKGICPLMSDAFISVRNWPPVGTVKYNTGLFEGKKKRRQ